MKTKDIINLIGKNNDLPIYAYVYGEVVGDPDACCSWLGKIKGARVANIAEVEPYGYYDRTIVELEDYEDYRESLLDNISEDIADEDIEEYLDKLVSELDYQKVILLDISTI